MTDRSDFDERLRRALERGERRRQDRVVAEQQAALTESQLKDLHTRLRLAISEHIEHTLGKIPDVLPGFRQELVYGDRGWGAAVSRDDFVVGPGGRRSNRFSRLEMTVRPYSSARILELSAKGTIRDKEVFNRNHFEPVRDADAKTFMDLVDTWSVEFVELYSAKA